MPQALSQGARRPSAIWAILGAFVVIGIIYSIVTPLGESPDESFHFRYVQYLNANHELPYTREQRALAGPEGHQPPLYYVVAAMATCWVDTTEVPRLRPLIGGIGDWRANPRYRVADRSWDVNAALHTLDEAFPYQGVVLAWHLARLVSLVMTGVAVWITYKIGRELCPANKNIGIGAAAISAFIPQRLFIAASVNNDNAVSMFSSLAVFVLIRIGKGSLEAKSAIACGFFIGCAVLSKANALVLLPVAFLILAVTAIRKRALYKGALCGAALATTTAATSGWHYLQNATAAGDVFAGQMFVNIERAPEVLSSSVWAALPSWLLDFYQIFWASFTFAHVPIPSGLFGAFGIVCLLAVFGWARFVVRTFQGHAGGMQQTNWAAAVVGVLVSVAYIAISVARFVFTGAPHLAQGRFLYPALSGIAVLVFAGLVHSGLIRSVQRWVWVVSVGFGLVALASPFIFISPAFGGLLPVRTTTDGLAIEHPLVVDLEDGVRLLGWSLSPSRIAPGGDVELTLYWEATAEPALDYTVFRHLKSGPDEWGGQGDGQPAGGRFPTTAWSKGDIIIDKRVISISEEARAGVYHLEVGMYYLPTLRRLAVSGDGATADAVYLGELNIGR